MNNKKAPDSLPLSRKSQLWFLIKDNPSLLMFVSLTAFAFLVPLGFVFTWLLLTFSAIVRDTSIQGLSAFYDIFYPSLTLILATMIAGIGFSGVYGVIHELVTKDYSKYKHFFTTLKSNLKQFVIYYGILGLFLFLVVINFAGYIYLDIIPFLKLISLFVSITLLTLFIFIKPFTLFQICMFNNSLGQIVRNSIGFIGKRFHFNLLTILLSNLFYALVLVLPSDLRVFALVVMGLFWIMFSCLCNYIICIDTLEKKLPKDQVNEFFHKGLEE